MLANYRIETTIPAKAGLSLARLGLQLVCSGARLERRQR